MLLKKANPEDMEQEWLFVRDMPEDENGLTNDWCGVSREDFERILTEPDNALTRQYKALLEVDRVLLTFDESAIDAIATAACNANDNSEDIGARRLHAIFEQLLEDISFNAGDENMPPFELVIDRKYVEEHLKDENKPADIRKYIL